MGTVTITSAGFAMLPTNPPDNWPGNIVWPGGVRINGTWTYTITDTDMQAMMSWMADTYQSQFVEPPTGLAVLKAWLDGFMQATTDSTQRHHTTPPVVPPPVSIS